jgi:hypothetical protein
MNQAQAQAILSETMMKVKGLEVEIDNLTGKENKKARNARSRVIAEMKKDVNYMDAERILAGKEALSPMNRDPNTPSKKVGEYDHLFATKATGVTSDGKLAYVAPTSDIGVTPKSKKKEKKATDLSDEEKDQMEKLKSNIMTKKSELKAEGLSGGQINKDSDIVEWVAKLNALKEKEAQLKGAMSDKDAKNDVKQKKGDEKELARLRDEIDAYKLKLKEEFGYSKQDINKDPDLVEMQQRFKEMGGK